MIRFRRLIVVLGVLLVSVGAVALGRRAYVEAIGTDKIDYRGEKIRLSKKYVDYDDYKNDPANLAASEIPRVERLMTDAQVGPDFADWHDAAHQLINIKFPGYGMASGENVVAAGREFAVRFMEIPQVAKERYFVLEKLAGGTFRLVDDFVAERDPGSAYAPISSIHLVSGRLVYADRNGKIVRETPVAR
ncbi:hypothetical protein GA0061098_102814 [Bradyrhizobium shewense]|uniref:Uncharacterized protein n=1 Tax=Bradyrhizobium shewense TaxID=1761772 RepID=A0A1C3XQN4_9BRAD|nr:hypothetical protein GA0061098_102814 [Bradyrhizobium shewense]